MRPFKMFFGLTLAIMLFFFVAKFFVIAFIAAAVMSILYAVFRRIKDFITFDSYGNHYFKGYEQNPRFPSYQDKEVEPLFYGDRPNRYYRQDDVRFVNIH